MGKETSISSVFPSAQDKEIRFHLQHTQFTDSSYNYIKFCKQCDMYIQVQENACFLI